MVYLDLEGRIGESNGQVSANAPPAEKSSLKLVISKKKKDDEISTPYKKHDVTPRAPSTPAVRPKVLRKKSIQKKP